MSKLSDKQLSTLKETKEVLTQNDGLWEHYPEDFIEGRTSFEEVKEIADKFYWQLKAIIRTFEKEIQ